jgi:TRAP-type C4-dicarboxylate transport system permease small subunit
MSRTPTERLTRLAAALAATIHLIAAVLLLAAVVLNFANIIGRYLLAAPIASAEEVMLFLLVGIVLLGNSVVAWEGRQIRMDVVLHLLPPRLRRLLDLLADLVAIVLSLVLVVLGWPVITMLAEFDQRSQAADIPLAIPQAIVPLGLTLTAILVAARLLLTRGRAPDLH